MSEPCSRTRYLDNIDNLICDCQPLSPEDTVTTIAQRFLIYKGMSALPVVSHNLLIGNVHSAAVVMSQITSTKLSTSAITAKDLMAHHSSVVESGSSLLEVCRLVREGVLMPDDGYVVVNCADGSFKGLVTTRDLLFHFSQLRLNYARYNNPLSRLPGSVPIDETIDHLLGASKMFVVVHCDINDFKGFNDTYGYSRGDDVILFVADLLQRHTDSELDFIGHTGGADFVIVFQSPDWFDHCEAIERECAQRAPDFYAEEHQSAGGINGFDRMGQRVFSPFFTLSFGAVQVEPGKFLSHHEVTSAAMEVKQRAKSTYGGAIYIDERSYSCPQTNRPFLRN